MFPRIITKVSRLRIFQYRLLNSVLDMNEMLFRFGKINSSPCSFRKMGNETPLYLFYLHKNKPFVEPTEGIDGQQKHYSFYCLHHRVPV